MEEESWRECQIKLAKSNINILNIEWRDNREECNVYYEFSYHPKPGKINWHKTVVEIYGVWDDKFSKRRPVYYEEIAEELLKSVLVLRKELEV